MRKYLRLFITLLLILSIASISIANASTGKTNNYVSVAGSVQGGESTDGRDLRSIRWGKLFCLNLGNSWGKGEFSEVGIDSIKIEELSEVIENKYNHILSVTIVKDNKLVFQKYKDGYNKNSLFVLNSATKTVTSTLIAIALKEGYINNIDEPFVSYFPQYHKAITDDNIKRVTIRDLLTMTSGLKWNISDMDKWVDSNKRIYKFDGEIGKNPIQYAFQLKVVHNPGEVFNYSTLNSQVLSGIITEATGMNAKDFANKYLFKPLSIKKNIWHEDPQGNNLGGFEMYLKATDMAKIGQLYLNNGKWKGKQILPEWWVEQATKAHNDGGFPHGEKYGFHCWVTQVGGYESFFAGGQGGQFIYVIPDLDLVVTITSDIDQHREYHRGIVSDFIVPSITALKL